MGTGTEIVNLCILQQKILPAIIILNIDITYLATANRSPREFIKISPSAKMNPRENQSP